MKKILFIHPSLGLGGAEKIIAFLANGLATTYETHILLLKSIPKTLELNESISVTVKECYYTRPIISKHFLRGMHEFKNMKIQIENTIKDIEPDLVIAFELRTALVLSIIKNRLGVNVLFSERADPYEHSIIWAYMLKRAYRRFEHIVFQTKGAKEYYGNIVENKSTIIPNPAIQRIDKYENDVDKTSERAKYIFAAGRFQKRKGFDLLIEAFAKIHVKHPEYKLRIYGDGQEKENYLHLIEKEGLTECVSLLPGINGVIEHNKTATLFVLPSRSEGMPNILMEAMISGIPSVACDCSPGGARIISDNGRYCRLAQKDNVESLAKELDYALDNLSIMSDMAKDAKIGMRRFKCSTIMDEWKKVVGQLLD